MMENMLGVVIHSSPSAPTEDGTEDRDAVVGEELGGREQQYGTGDHRIQVVLQKQLSSSPAGLVALSATTYLTCSRLWPPDRFRL
jgi:hypothetical protein